MTTAFAFEADIGAESDNRPFVGTAGMRLAQTQEIVELEIGEHEIIESCVKRLYRAESYWRHGNL